MSREVCGICWCPYDENTGECACAPQSLPAQEPIAWYHVPYPNNGAAPMVSLSKQHEPSMYGAVVPLFLGAPHCPNCASLQDQNTELDRKLADLEQTSLELCETCGWRTLIPGDCCLNCARKPLNEFDALRLITSTVGLLQSAGPVEGMIGIIRAVERAHGIGVNK